MGGRALEARWAAAPVRTQQVIRSIASRRFDEFKGSVDDWHKSVRVTGQAIPRRSVLYLGVIMLSRLFALWLILAMTGTVPLAVAQTWVEVNDGSWPLDAASLGRIEQKLQATVVRSAKTQGQKLPPWLKYLIQYRATLVNGHRVVEIRGACRVSPGLDLRREFLDVVDGGLCYFTLMYTVESERFCNVIFNGRA